MMKTNINLIKKKAVPILQKAGVSHCTLFGSYAKGEQKKDSDIDILVELPKGNSLLDLIRLERKLEAALGKKVDLLTYKSISPLLKDHIQKNQLPIL